jgi:hypothetical protein
MEEKMSLSIWVIATLFGGVGAFLCTLLVEQIKSCYKRKRVKKNFKRELKFNIDQLSININELTKLKEDFIKLDRQDFYFHYFTFNHSSVLFRAMISSGVIYDYLNNEQMLKFDQFLTECGNTEFLNKEVQNIRNKTYTKQYSANQVDWFLNLYTVNKAKLEEILSTI